LVLIKEIKIMGFVKEFKEFAVKGNVVDLAVAVVIGAAFGKIITSFIDDIITPLLLKPALDAAHLTNIQDLTIFGTVKYGSFLSAVISFVIVALVLFLVIKGINSLKKKEDVAPSAPPVPTKEEILLTEIRDLLKNK
jgi:large conductance mechanosensitive channel